MNDILRAMRERALIDPSFRRAVLATAESADPLAALCDETIQLFVPGRSGQITDVWLDTAGYLAGALLTLLLFSLCRKRPKQRKTP